MFGLSYIRIGAYAVIAIIMGYLIYQYRTGQEAKAELATVKQSLTDEIAAHNAYIATRAAQDSITAKVSTDYENAITDLVGQLNAARGSSIRVCKPALQSSTSPSNPASRPNEAIPNGSGAEVEQMVSASELYEIAGEAVECGERLNHLQDWIRQQNQLSSNP